MNRRSRRLIVVVVLCFTLWMPDMQRIVAASAKQAPGSLGARELDEHLAPLQPSPDASPQGLEIISANGDRIELLLQTPGYTIKDVATPDGSCQEISISGYQTPAEPGYPALPVRHALFGIPVDARPEVRLIEEDFLILPDRLTLCPVPSPIIAVDAKGEPGQIAGWYYEPDPSVYATDDVLPGDSVTIVPTGFIRDQRVAELRLSPVQYNPASGEVRITTYLRAEILLNAGQEVIQAPQSNEQAAPDPFDDLLRTILLNYEEARAWRRTPADAALDRTVTTSTLSAANPDLPVYRIQIRDPGLYLLTYGDIAAADPTVDLTTVDPRNFHLTTRGEEVAIEVVGEADGFFGASDAITFYAEAIDTVYSDVNSYWLSWDDSPGRRMTVLDAEPTGTSAVPTHFLTTRLIEEDLVYRPDKATADGGHWFWRIMGSVGSPVTRSFPFEITDLSTEPLSAILRGDLIGTGAVPLHSVAVSVNGHTVYTATWPSNTTHLFEVAFPHAYLVAGTNTIAVTNGINNSRDGLLVDRFHLTYGTPYTAHNDVLWFDGDDAGVKEFRLTNFTTDAIRLVDITSPTLPSRIVGWTAHPDLSGYTIAFEQNLQEERRYLATTTALVKSPLAVVRETPSSLSSPDNHADYIVITHGDFTPAAESLAAYRETQGLRTTVVDVQHIYNEFSFGIPDAEAIRAFLAHAYATWAPPAPTYVVLLGDGHYDPTDNLGTQEPSPIPPYLANVDPWIGETAADHRYVTVSGEDRLADMFIGRLPANTLAEAHALVNKVMSYEQLPVGGSWQSDLLFVADDKDDAGDFATLSDAVANARVPTPYQVEKIYLGITHAVTEPIVAQTAVLDAINGGKLIVNYVGHGARAYWASERLLDIEVIPNLTNAGRLPFFVPMTCWEGYYIRPGYPALGEAIVRLPTTGAIASWSPTGLGLATGHDVLHRGLYEALFQEDLIELGPATTYAKSRLAATGMNLDLLDTYLLFGDPATRLNVLPADLQVTKTVAGNLTGFSSGDAITYTLTFTNAGPVTANRVVISDTLPTVLTSLAWTSSGAPITARAGSTYVWDAGSLPAGAGGTITITGLLPEAFEGALTNVVEISTTTREVETGNNRSQVTVIVSPYRVYLPLTLRGTP
jgi:uncharacterized repeat protein (TIGR01451 family)